MSVLYSDREEEVFTPDELAAYEEGRKAHADGKHYFDKPYTNRPRSEGDNLDWGWTCGYLDAEAGVPLEARLEAERNGRRV